MVSIINWSAYDWEIVALVHIIGGSAALHALLTKRDPRAALSWIAICLMLPLIGVIIYLLFGVNYIAIKEKKIEPDQHELAEPDQLNFATDSHKDDAEAMFERHAFDCMVQSSRKITGWPLLKDCNVEPLYDGTQAYPEMLHAIAVAKRTVYLSTYLFGTHGKGKEFIEALAEAHRRGVNVRVLVDGVGGMYSFPTAKMALQKRGVRVAAFLSPYSTHSLHLNLRNHRKIMVVDGKVGFTGGMNIHDDNFAEPGKTAKIRDLHFKVQGPIIKYLQEVFIQDWYFTTKESLPNIVDYANMENATALCRGIAPGPHYKKALFGLMFCSAVSCAQRHVRIMSPYFLLSNSQMSAVISAALRGVKIEVILPEANNLSFVKGACEALLPYLMEYGVEVYYRPGHFAHTKMLVIDDFCVFLGSSNLDIRSLMLNFEFNLEVYDHDLAKKMIDNFEEVKQGSRLISLNWLKSRGFRVKLMNAIFKLFSLYL